MKAKERKNMLEDGVSWEVPHILLLIDQKIVIWPHVAAREDRNIAVCLATISVTVDAGRQKEVSGPSIK